VGTYRGTLEFRPDGAGGIETVNVIGLDDYVRGVISAEMPAGWSPAALEAQAVAARTYAITSDAGGAVFDLYPDTRSQMYRGVAAETPSTDAAVAATHGQMVTYRGSPVVTYFFNSSGGHTENIENVWFGSTPEPWLRGVSDPYDNAGGDPYHRWSYAMSTSSAQARLGGLVKGSLVGIQVLKHGVSPRIITAAVVGTRGRTVVSGPHVQHLFGLLTTYAAFATISAAPGRIAHPTRQSRARAAAQSQAVAALVPLVHALVGAMSGLHGSVFPAPKGARIAIQQSTRKGWRTVIRTRLGTRGTYDSGVPAPGTYRIVYDGFYGPPVTVG
jgi:stage II sporulation protein D